MGGAHDLHFREGLVDAVGGGRVRIARPLVLSAVEACRSNDAKMRPRGLPQVTSGAMVGDAVFIENFWV